MDDAGRDPDGVGSARARSQPRERAQAGGPHPHSGKRTRRTTRRVIIGTTLALLLVAGTLVGNALNEAGCGHGREAVIAQLVPLGGARATFSEDNLKDLCNAGYTTTAVPADIFAHHGAQLTAQGWTVTRSDPTTFPPYLEARRDDLSVYVWVDRVDGENLVQLLASRLG